MRSRWFPALFLFAAAARAADPPPASTPLPPPPSAARPFARPAYAVPAEPLPIDLPTVLRLVNENSPVVGFARARVRQAVAQQMQARVLFLPDLVTGTVYNRLDGRNQNANGTLFDVNNRANLVYGGGPSLQVNVADGLFAPLVARRATNAERLSAQATVIDAQLDAALAYLDLLQVYALLAINADTLARDEQMLKAAQAAQEAQLSKTAGDVNRANAEVFLRRQERLELLGRAGAASARLAQLLLLQPSVDLKPADPAVVAVTLIDPTKTLDDLIGIAIASRPDLGANRELVAAAWQRVRQAKAGPLLPRVSVDQRTGSFGGGVNDTLTNFGSQNTVNVQLFWELRNLGAGNAAQIRERRAEHEQALYRLAEVQARVAADVAEAAKVAGTRFEAIPLAEQAVIDGAELYRKLRDTSFGMVGQRRQYDPIEPLLAIQQLNQARVQYLSAVIEFNRAQFRLFAALGYPVDRTPGPLPAEPLGVPVVPPPPQLPSMGK
jgi:outer membrane protein TolC